MGQREVYDWFKSLSSKEQEVYYSSREVFEGMKVQGLISNDNMLQSGRVRKWLNDLVDGGFLEYSISGTLCNWHCKFKIKK